MQIEDDLEIIMDKELLQLKKLGADYEQAVLQIAEKEAYAEAVKAFFSSHDFMRLGQAIHHKQWQAASMKAMKMSNRARELGCVGIEKSLNGIRMNINCRNDQEALQLLSVLITKRVRILAFFQGNKGEE